MRVEQTDTFRKWLDGLKDRAGRARVLVRIDRLIGSNPGQHRQLAGGDKSTQRKDIAAATRLARQFSEG